jgi:tetrahedral aminopeptidase
MVDAHTDEVGLMITRFEKNGLLGFRIVGGIDDRLLLAKGVIVGEQRLPGVIVAPPCTSPKRTSASRSSSSISWPSTLAPAAR